MGRILISLFLLTLPFPCLSQERKFQIWSSGSAKTRLRGSTWLGASGKTHYSPGNSGLDLKFGDVKIEQEITDWFKLGGGGRLLWIKKEYGWLQEKRPMLYGDLTAKMNPFELDFSNRIEYRFLNKAENHWRHRQKVTLNFPAIIQKRLIMFTAFESFFKFNTREVHLARLYAGIDAIRQKYFDLQVYYVFEKNRQPGFWNTTDVLGISISVEI